MGIFTRLFGGGQDAALARPADEESMLAAASSTAAATAAAVPPALPRTSDRGSAASIEPRGRATAAPSSLATVVAPAPPAPSPTTVAPSVPAASAQAAPAAPSRRTKSDSIADAFDLITAPAAEPSRAKPTSSAADLEAVRGLFEDVAAVHVGQVRDVVLELRYGTAGAALVESTRPALRSLRAMAEQMELRELCTALDRFCAATEVRTLDESTTQELLRRYDQLVTLIPKAFELDGERDRREPIIVDALLSQIPGLERPMIDKLFAAGLSRLDALLRADANELAAVSGIREDIARAIVAQLKAYRGASGSVLSAADPAAERRRLHDLAISLAVQTDEYERLAAAWSERAPGTRREVHRNREQTFQQIRVVLARLGQQAVIARLERAAYRQRVAILDELISKLGGHGGNGGRA